MEHTETIVILPDPPTPQPPAIPSEDDEEDIFLSPHSPSSSTSTSSATASSHSADGSPPFDVNTDLVKLSISRGALERLIARLQSGVARLPATPQLAQLDETLGRMTMIMADKFDPYDDDYDDRVLALLRGMRETRGLSVTKGLLFWVYLNAVGHCGYTLLALLEEELIALVHALFTSTASSGFFKKSSPRPHRSSPELSALLRRQFVVVDSEPLWAAYTKLAESPSAQEIAARRMRLHFLLDVIGQGEFDPDINRHMLPLPSVLALHQIGTRELPSHGRSDPQNIVYRLVSVGPIDAVNSSREFVKKQMTISTAAFVKSFEYDSKVSQVLMTGMSFMYYGMLDSQAQRKFRESHTSIQNETGASNIVSIWNLLDDPGFIKFSAGMMFVKLPAKGMRKVTIPVPKPIFPQTDANLPQRQPSADEEDEDNSELSSSSDPMITVIPTTFPSSSSSSSSSSSASAASPSNDHTNQPHQDLNNEDILTQDHPIPHEHDNNNNNTNNINNNNEPHDVITARFLSSTKLPCWSDATPLADRALILHFHGGGFIAMSSYSHQDYSRQWARQTGLPILSVDYRLAPAFPYPTGVNDCWAAYVWACEHSHAVLGAPPHRIVVTGDSAGGGLTASVTLRAIRDGYRVPDGVLMSYPALNLYRYAMLPSRVLAFKDAILPFAFLDLVIRAYIPEHLILSAKEDPLLSPAHAPDDWLARFPPAFIGAGDVDPLYHDSIQFAHRLHRLRRPFGLSVYHGFPHGYLSFSALIKQAKKIIVETGHQLAALARGTFGPEMMFAPPESLPLASSSNAPSASPASEPPVLSDLPASPSPADNYPILFCRNANYASPSYGEFHSAPDHAPQPLHFAGAVQLKGSGSLSIWHQRFVEVRSQFLMAWKSDAEDASFEGCWILRDATFSRDLDNPKYIELSLFEPDAKNHALSPTTLTLYSADQPTILSCLEALSKATEN